MAVEIGQVFFLHVLEATKTVVVNAHARLSYNFVTASNFLFFPKP